MDECSEFDRTFEMRRVFDSDDIDRLAQEVEAKSSSFCHMFKVYQKCCQLTGAVENVPVESQITFIIASHRLCIVASC